MRVEFRWGAESDVGQVREANQDSLLIADWFFAVADGMGGHQGGEVASAIAVDILREAVGEPSTAALVAGVQEANTSIIDRASGESNLRGMGTTLCAIALVGDGEDRRLAVVNVGDSRVYRFADEEIEQVTEDHSYVEGLVREGYITPEEAEVHPQRNILTRALGVNRELIVDEWELPVRHGDRFVLCSDGLFNEVHNDQIAATLRRLADPAEAARDLIRQANESGARDNVTVVIVEVIVPDGEAGDEEHEPIALPEKSSTTVADESTDAGPPAIGEERGEDQVEDTPARDDGAVDGDEASVEAGETVEKKRWWSFRSWLLGLSVLAVLAVAFTATAVVARSGYFATIDDGEVVIAKGRPDGLLWFEPTIEVRTGIPESDLSGINRELLVGVPEFGSLDEATRFVSQVLDPADADASTASG
jgi:serine/threonine protein phosphatase PrpC